MQLEVKIDQDAVQQQVVQAIMNSAIGEAIAASVHKGLTEETGPWTDRKTLIQRAVDEVLRREIAQIAADLVRSKREEIKAQMVEKMTDEVLGKMIEAAWSVMNGRLEKD